MLKIWPYKIASKSAKALAKALGVKRIVNPNYRVKRKDIILNWGNTQVQHAHLNRGVHSAADKRVAFTLMANAGVSVPEFTTRWLDAQLWLDAGDKVVVRKLVSAHSGLGASIVKPGEDLPEAPLYTRYFKRDAEFRVHVFNGQVIDYVRKKRRNGYEQDPNHNDHIRTHLFGWVFCRDGVVLPDAVRDQAIDAVSALSLTFGAVDVLWRERGDAVVVLEVNTAPGLEGTTLSRYVEAIRNYIQLRRVEPRSRS